MAEKHRKRVNKDKKTGRMGGLPRNVLDEGVPVVRYLIICLIALGLSLFLFQSIKWAYGIMDLIGVGQGMGGSAGDEWLEYRDYGTYGPVVGGIDCGDEDCSANIHYRPGVNVEGEYVELFYTDDPDLKSFEGPVPGRVSGESDYVAVFELESLMPETRYYYKVIDEGGVLVGGKPDETPSFRTFPLASEEASFSFVVFADLVGARQEKGGVKQLDVYGVPGYRSAVTDDFTGNDEVVSDLPAFFMQIGDFDHRDPARFSYDINNWRRMHRDVMYNLPSGQDFHRYIAPSMPVFHMWDDHDYGANNQGGNARFKSIASKAFLEYYPLPDLPNDPRKDGAGGLWHSFRYGQVEFIILDSRSQREYGTGSLDKKWFTWLKRDRGRMDRFSDRKSMLGNKQLEWLYNRLLESDAKWKFIITPSVWNQLGTKPFESWNVYPTERELVKEMILYAEEQHMEENPDSKERHIFISGDIHSGGAVDLGLNNKNLFPEISVPHSNLCLARPTSGYTKGAQAGSWYYFKPGSQDLIKRVEDEFHAGTQFNAGYALIEVHHLEETSQGNGLDDWITIKIINTEIFQYQDETSGYVVGDISDASVNCEISIEL